MFPETDSSETIIQCLLKEADRFNVDIKMNRDVKNILRTGNKWSLQYSNGEQEEADFVCAACGGYPKSSMFEWLMGTGHTIEEPVPSLFTFNMPGNSMTTLMGVSANAAIKILGSKFDECGPVLITHWGLSGPAVLKLSARAAKELHARNYRYQVLVNWLPDFNEQSLRKKWMSSKKTIVHKRL